VDGPVLHSPFDKITIYLTIKLDHKKKYLVFAWIMAAFFVCITVFFPSSLLAVWPCMSLGLL
jgi:hypothetical protein